MPELLTQFNQAIDRVRVTLPMQLAPVTHQRRITPKSEFDHSSAMFSTRQWRVSMRGVGTGNHMELGQFQSLNQLKGRPQMAIMHWVKRPTKNANRR
jgi:hypothetical protein